MYATLEQRRDAREAVESLGKFEGESPMVPILYSLVSDGFADESVPYGDSVYDRVGRWILWTTSQGFVTGARYDTQAEAAKTMGEMEAYVALALALDE